MPSGISVQDNDDGAAQQDPSVLKALEENRMQYIRPAGVTPRPVYLQRPEKRYGWTGKYRIREHMGQNQQAAKPVS